MAYIEMRLRETPCSSIGMIGAGLKPATGTEKGTAMNLKEGTRRLALILGAVGALLGGFASYMELQTVLSQSALHNKFERLANSDVVKQARTDWVFARIPPDYDAVAKSLGGTTTVPLFDPQGRVRDVPSGDVSKALRQAVKERSDSRPQTGKSGGCARAKGMLP